MYFTKICYFKYIYSLTGSNRKQSIINHRTYSIHIFILLSSCTYFALGGLSTVTKHKSVLLLNFSECSNNGYTLELYSCSILQKTKHVCSQNHVQCFLKKICQNSRLYHKLSYSPSAEFIEEQRENLLEKLELFKVVYVSF